MVVLAAGRVIRAVHAALGVVIAALGPLVFIEGSDSPSDLRSPLVAVIAVPLAVGAWFATRALRLGVVCAPEHVTVRGLLWSRTIPITSVTGVPDESDGWFGPPMLAWRDARGHRRWTPLYAFWVGTGVVDGTRADAEARLRRLRQHWRSPGSLATVQPTATDALAPGMDSTVSLATADTLLHDLSFGFWDVSYDADDRTLRLETETDLRPIGGGWRRRPHRVTVEIDRCSCVSVDPERSPLGVVWIGVSRRGDDVVVESGVDGQLVVTTPSDHARVVVDRAPMGAESYSSLST